MNTNSAEAIKYISLNLSKITRFHSNKMPIEVAEDFCQKLILALLMKPRYIPNIPAYVNVVLKRGAIRHSTYNNRFFYISSNKDDDNNLLDLDLEDPISLESTIEDSNLRKCRLATLSTMIEHNLTDRQKQSIEQYIANDGRHTSDLDKVHFNQSVYKLKINKHRKKSISGKKRGRKAGFKPISSKLGRRSKITVDLTAALVSSVRIVDGYIVNMAEMVKKFDLSNRTITKILKTQISSLNKERKKMFSLDFLKEEAKKFNSRTEWQNASPGQYQRARKMGWLDECTTHMLKSYKYL